MKKKLIALAVTATFITGVAEALPWCHRGTIVQIADVSWSEANILANFLGTVPTGVYDPEHYITHTATNNYANTCAGGGGGFGGYRVPGSGQVVVEAYAPYSYTNMIGPGNYFTSQGVQFKLKKCYTIPPMTIVHNYAEINKPDGPVISVKPFKELMNIRKYWDIVDPDDDYDKNEKPPIR